MIFKMFFSDLIDLKDGFIIKSWDFLVNSHIFWNPEYKSMILEEISNID